MDVKLIETGNGGDFVLTTNDLAVVGGVENMPYISMFGGDNFWGNDLFLADDAARQFNARTERVLTETALNSAGRNIIQTAVDEDISFMSEIIPGTIIVTDVSLTGNDKLKIKINMNGQQIGYEWNPSADKIVVE